MSQITIGARLRSQVCDTEVIVVRATADDLVLTCGGHPLVPFDADRAEGLALDEASSGGSLLGKRYTRPDTDLELLVTKAGQGTLAVAAEPLVLKDAKPLPSSD